MRFQLFIFLLLWGGMRPAAQVPVPLVLDSSLSTTGLPRLIRGDEVGIWESQQKEAAYMIPRHIPDALYTTAGRDCCGFNHDANRLWVRIQLQNRGSAEMFYLELVNPFINKIYFFQTDTTGKLLDTDSTGTIFHFHQRPVRHRNFLFPFNCKPGQSTYIYLALEPDYPLYIKMLVWDAGQRFGDQQRLEDILLTVFFVFCILYLILSAMLIVQSKQYYTWSYFIYVVLSTLFIPAYLGLGFRYVWPDIPYLQFVVPAAINCLRLVFGIQFFREYFDTGLRFPRLDRLLYFSLWVFFSSAILMALHYWAPFALMKLWLRVFFIFLMGFSLIMLGWTLRQPFVSRRQNVTGLLLVLGLHFFIQFSTALQLLGHGGYDPLATILPFGARTQTFFVKATQLGGFFIEMLLVFFFAVNRYFRLIEHSQRVQAQLGAMREQGLHNLITGIEKERRRIAADLHDGACVSLAAIRMKLETLQVQFPEAAPALSVLIEDVELTYRETRDISHNLMSKALEKTDLISALEELISRVRQARPELEIHWYHNVEFEKLSPALCIHLYRISQELFNNILRHSKAQNVDFQLLENKGNELSLSVSDDGCGFDLKSVAENGIGLANVRLRVTAIKGQLQIDSSPERGTFVRIEIPEAFTPPKAPVS